MLRAALAIVLINLTVMPTLAWETRLGRVCELVHEEENASVRLTYDPLVPEYSIAITLRQQWVNNRIFAMRFDGPRGLQISTDRHVISNNGATLSVTDSGFGNVLNGLEFNQTATALLGDQSVSVPLDGVAPAAPAVRAFRTCTSGLNA